MRARLRAVRALLTHGRRTVTLPTPVEDAFLGHHSGCLSDELIAESAPLDELRPSPVFATVCCRPACRRTHRRQHAESGVRVVPLRSA